MFYLPNLQLFQKHPISSKKAAIVRFWKFFLWDESLWTKFWKWTTDNGRRIVCTNKHIKSGKLNTVVHRLRNNTHREGADLDLKRTQYENFIFKRVSLWRYIEVFFRQFILLEDKAVKIEVSFFKSGSSLSFEHFPPVFENLIYRSSTKTSANN